MLTAGVAAEHEHEASQMEFVPLGSVVRRLKRHPETFCAPELLPAALLDSYMDVCAWLRAEHTGSSVGRRRHYNAAQRECATPSC